MQNLYHPKLCSYLVKGKCKRKRCKYYHMGNNKSRIPGPTLNQNNVTTYSNQTFGYPTLVPHTQVQVQPIVSTIAPQNTIGQHLPVLTLRSLSRWEIVQKTIQISPPEQFPTPGPIGSLVNFSFSSGTQNQERTVPEHLGGNWTW